MDYLGAADGYEAMAFDADVQADIGAGFGPGAAIRRAMAKMQQRRQARQAGGIPQHPAPAPADNSHGRPPAGWGWPPRRGDDDDGDDVGDDDDLAADDAEIDDLGADDEGGGVGADDDDIGAENEEIGAIGDRIAKLREKRAELVAKLSATPRRRERRRRRLQRAIDRADRHILRKTQRRDRKIVRVARKLGIAPQALIAAGGLAAGAGAIAAATGRSPGQIQATMQESRRREIAAARGGPRSVYNDVPVAAQNVVIPLLFAGLPVLSSTIAIGAGLRTVAYNAISPSISFAKFKVTGLKFDLQVSGAPGDIHANALIDQYIVNGGINLLYSAGTNLRSFAQASADRSSTGGTSSYSGVISGLRDMPILDRTNQATATGSIRQEVTTAAIMNITLQLALVGDVLEDENIRSFS